MHACDDDDPATAEAAEKKVQQLLGAAVVQDPEILLQGLAQDGKQVINAVVIPGDAVHLYGCCETFTTLYSSTSAKVECRKAPWAAAQAFDTDASVEAQATALADTVNPFKGKRHALQRLFEKQSNGEKQAMLTCSLHAPGALSEEVLPCGLCSGHEYGMEGLFSIRDSTGKEHSLVKLLNPHGHGEWNGAYCDSDPIWNDPLMCQARVEKLGMPVGEVDDGLMCISWADFSTTFTRLDLSEGFMHEAFLKQGCAQQANGLP